MRFEEGTSRDFVTDAVLVIATLVAFGLLVKETKTYDVRERDVTAACLRSGGTPVRGVSGFWDVVCIKERI